MSARSYCSASVAGACVGTEGAFSGISVASIFHSEDRHLHGWLGDGDCGGVFPRTGNGLPGADGVAFGVGETAGWAADVCGEAAGVLDAPGCEPGSAPAGLTAAAGCTPASERGPAIEIGLGVPVGCGAGDALGEGGAAPAGAGEAACAAAAAIGFAGAGLCRDSSATVNSIARAIGTRTTPLFLSIQP